MQVLTITVVPSASRNDVVPTGQDNYKVYVTAPAQKGKANKDMLKILSKHLGLPVSHLIISRGDRSNKKPC